LCGRKDRRADKAAASWKSTVSYLDRDFHATSEALVLATDVAFGGGCVVMNEVKPENGGPPAPFPISDRAFGWGVTLAFTAVLAFAALLHVMWRDEWIPLTIARHTDSYADFFSEIRYLGRNGFFSFVWLLNRLGGIALFKAALIAISAAGVFLFARYAPFGRSQKALFAFGYYPLYEYGTILRDYGALLTLSIASMALLGSRSPRHLVFGLVIALLAQTNAFGFILAATFGAALLADLWQRGLLKRHHMATPGFLAGGALALASLALAASGFIQTPEVTRAVLGGALRADSHWLRLAESAPFPFRAWFPIPAFGLWNSQLLDPWPILQIVATAVLAVWFALALRRSFAALFLFGFGMLAMMAILCHLPWTALRYHGPYFILVVAGLWLAERDARQGNECHPNALVGGRVVGLLTSPVARRGFLTAMLAVHAVVGITFVIQERLVPFSGSRAAAQLIRDREPPDVLVLVDPDYAAISLAGCLGREVYIAGRDEPGAFTKVDTRRRLERLSAEELSAVVERKLQQERRDVVLVTNYEVRMPQELGTLLGVTQAVTDERYYVFRMRYRSR
jgi:hypothetical protein